MTTYIPAVSLGAETFGAFGTGVYSTTTFGVGGGTIDDVTDPCSTITINRGVEADGLTEKLVPGICTIVLNDLALSPVTDPRTRPGQPLHVYAAPEGTEDAAIPVFTGIISRSRLGYVDDKVQVILEARDRVNDLANTSVTDTTTGTYAQRVRHLMDPTGIPYAVTDRQPDEPTTHVLPGTKDDDKLLDALYLVRDTMHGIAYVSAENLPTFIAYRDRGRTPAALTLTDGSTPGLEYLDIEPAFDTDDAINLVTIELLTDPETPPVTYDNVAAGPEWGPHAQAITVNDGDTLHHAIRYGARIPAPGLAAGPIRLNPVLGDDLGTIAALEPYDPVRVVLDGQIDTEHQILGVTHTITPMPLEDGRGWFKWITTLTSRRREVLPTMWQEVPPTVTWADVPGSLDWLHAITWHPETP